MRVAEMAIDQAMSVIDLTAETVCQRVEINGRSKSTVAKHGFRSGPELKTGQPSRVLQLGAN